MISGSAVVKGGGGIASKYEGGQWALENLSDKYIDIIDSALNKYSGEIERGNVSSSLLKEFLEVSFNEIDSCIEKNL